MGGDCVVISIRRELHLELSHPIFNTAPPDSFIYCVAKVSLNKDKVELHIAAAFSSCLYIQIQGIVQEVPLVIFLADLQAPLLVQLRTGQEQVALANHIQALGDLVQQGVRHHLERTLTWTKANTEAVKDFACVL